MSSVLNPESRVLISCELSKKANSQWLAKDGWPTSMRKDSGSTHFTAVNQQEQLSELEPEDDIPGEFLLVANVMAHAANEVLLLANLERGFEPKPANITGTAADVKALETASSETHRSSRRSTPTRHCH